MLKLIPVILTLIFISFNSSASDNLESFNFGIGIGIEYYDDQYIDRASINGTNKVVIVEKEFRSRPSLWLATNWTNDTPLFSGGRWGFFLGAKVLDEKSDSLSAFAIGPQLVFSRPGKKDKNGSKQSLNIGIGWVVSHNVKTLSDGIERNKPLPAEFDEIKYTEKQRASVMLMVSTNFN